MRKDDGHDAARAARVHALGEDLDGEAGAGHAPQRGRGPEAVVVAAERVEADDEARRADALGQVVDVGGQVRAARLLAGLDHPDAAGVAAALGLHRLDGGEGGEHGVPVVGAATPVQAAVGQHRLPRAEPVAPGQHRWLLVEVAVEQDGVVVERRVARRHLEPQERAATVQPDHLDLEALHVALLAPLAGQLDDVVEVPVLGPVGVERRGHRGDADVVGEGRQDVPVPHLGGAADGGAGVERHRDRVSQAFCRRRRRCSAGGRRLGSVGRRARRRPPPRAGSASRVGPPVHRRPPGPLGRRRPRRPATPRRRRPLPAGRRQRRRT